MFTFNALKKIDFKRHNIELMLLTAAWVTLSYSIPNKLGFREPWPVPVTIFDRWVRMSSVWIWAYVSYYFYIGSVYVFCQNLFRRQVIFYSYFCASTISFFWFFIWPTSIPRALYAVEQTGSVSDQLLNFIRYIDNSINCFPSMHVALSMIATLCVWMKSKRLGVIASIWFLLISYSTMAVKQHYFYDVAGGTALGVICWATCYLILRRAHAQRTS